MIKKNGAMVHIIDVQGNEILLSLDERPSIQSLNYPGLVKEDEKWVIIRGNSQGLALKATEASELIKMVFEHEVEERTIN